MIRLQRLKKSGLNFVVAFIALVIGLTIVKLALGSASIIRDNAVSCIPEELSEMFDHEQATLCSNTESRKNTLVISVMAGGGLALMGIILALASTLMLLRGKKKDPRNFRL